MFAFVGHAAGWCQLHQKCVIQNGVCKEKSLTRQVGSAYFSCLFFGKERSAPRFLFFQDDRHKQKMTSIKHFLCRGVVTKSTMWDFLVFRKIQQSLGGRVRVVSTGSAPVSTDVLEFARICFGCMVGVFGSYFLRRQAHKTSTFLSTSMLYLVVQVLEGYGQTETTGAVTVTLPYDMSAGTVVEILDFRTTKKAYVPSHLFLGRAQRHRDGLMESRCRQNRHPETPHPDLGPPCHQTPDPQLPQDTPLYQRLHTLTLCCLVMV